MRISNRDSGQGYVARVGDLIGVGDRSSRRRIIRYVRGLRQSQCRRNGRPYC